MVIASEKGARAGPQHTTPRVFLPTSECDCKPKEPAVYQLPHLVLVSDALRACLCFKMGWTPGCAHSRSPSGRDRRGSRQASGWKGGQVSSPEPV